MLDKNYITTAIQSILNKEFSTLIERRINVHDSRINFRCPYCHEGRTKSKKRGNLYFEKLLYICFRCGKKNNLDRFLKDFNYTLDPDKKMQMIEHLNSVVSYKDTENDFIDSKLDNLINLSELESIFNSGENVITDFKPVTTGGVQFKYLIQRGITPNLHFNIFEGKYWINSDRWEPIIIILNRRNTKVLGAQIRNLKDGKKRLFKIYNFETLYKLIHSDVDNIDINQLVMYNKLSYYFNILNIDFDKPITIFEGYLDSLFYPNSLGVVGINTNMFFMENNNLDLQYFFDNDPAGFDKTEEKLRMGYPVFLWRKLFEDIVSRKKTDDPHKLLFRISKVKDLNKLSELVPEPYRNLELDKFFSKDIMDIRWIPKKISRSKTYVKK